MNVGEVHDMQTFYQPRTLLSQGCCEMEKNNFCDINQNNIPDSFHIDITKSSTWSQNVVPRLF